MTATPLTQSIPLHWLDTRPTTATGVTWGISLPPGALPVGTPLHLTRADSGALPTQTWPLAFWPDGSIKWLGCAAVVGPDDGESFSLVAGPGPAPATPLRITQPGIEVIRVVETGTMTVEVGDRGRYLIQEIARDGRLAAGGAELVCLLERRRQDGRLEVREREPFAGIIEQATVEQAGPVRGVVRLTGRYRGEQSGRLWLPFTVRLVFYAGCDTVEMVHSFVFDGDVERDFIAGLGLRVHVPLQDGAHNRHIRVVGDEGAGVWSEPVRMLPYAGHAATAEQLVQARGEAVPAPARGGMLPVWNDVQLLQDSCDHAQVRKRQDAGCCWITAEHSRRAPGILSLSEPAGGLAVGLRDFWQSHPACIEATGAGGTEAAVAAWWWAPQAEPMDLRHYGHRDYRDVYEARNPDPAVYSSPLGIARTSQLMLWTLPAGSRAEDLRLRSEQVQRPPLLAASPQHYHACGAFGPAWAPVDRSTPDLAALEDELAGQIGYLLEEIDTWRWYGFWHYGDFMHTYDQQRHCWHYDQGGRAWQNTELAADIWPWYAFLRSGEARLFRFAEAMTRHVSEVDVFHLGPWTGQGSRHNVVHWGCPCKEPRASQAGAKRFYYYLTADERCRDLLDEVAAQADQFKATNVPTDRVMARIGPTWVAWAANWFCAWERTRDPRWMERIRTGLRGILAAPYRLMQGDPFDYDPATGVMRHAGDIPFPSNRLAFSMGGAEALLEMEPHLGVDGLREALLEFAREHLRDPRQRETWPEAMRLRVGMIWGYTRLIAWAGRTTGDAAILRRAAEILVEGDQDPAEGRTGLPVTWQTTTRPMAGETHREGLRSTNLAAVGGLNIIACLALAPRDLEAAWRRQAERAAEARQGEVRP
jgi:hypothetical protein